MSKRKRERPRERKREKPPFDPQSLLLPALLLLLMAGFYLLLTARGGEAPSSTVDPRTVRGVFTYFSEVPSTHQPGRVQMIDFFDFYCPHCYDLYRRLPTLQEKYRERLEILHVGFPLSERSIRPFEAYYLAQEAGKGEAMADALFAAIHEENRPITDDLLLDLAEEIGLDPEEFQRGLESRSQIQRIQAGVALAERYGVRQTPTLVLDGQFLTLDHSSENLETIIDSLLEEGG
jgi:thiol:disulfide interchange protein DsbA